MKKQFKIFLISVVILGCFPSIEGADTLKSNKKTSEIYYNELRKAKPVLIDDYYDCYQEEQEKLKEESEEYVSGWLSENTNIRLSPFTFSDANIAEVLPIGSEVTYCVYNSEWAKVKYGDGIGYISLQYISNEKPYKEYSVPRQGIKSYMSYKKITNRASSQYKLQHSVAYTGDYGIRQIDGRFCVAVGSYFTKTVGIYIDLVLQNGTVIPCVLADRKADKDTDSRHILTTGDNSLVEFIIDNDVLPRRIKRSGDISSACEQWNSQIVSIRIYNKKV